MEYYANDRRFFYSTRGETRWGDNTVLLNSAVDLTTDTSWHKEGYTIQPLFPSNLYEAFSTNVRDLLIQQWRKSGLVIDDHFQLDRYHTVAYEQGAHLRAVEKIKLLSIEDFPIPIERLEERISQICNVPLITKNPFDRQRIFHFRVIRPSSSDNNPLHRDVWLEDYDNCINLYIPIAGSNELTSLMIVPGSHTWPESKIERTVAGAVINDVKFNVPAVTAVDGPFEVKRPSPGRNEVLVFSPYLIHGGAINSSPDQTRISIEIRLWKV